MTNENLSKKSLDDSFQRFGKAYFCGILIGLTLGAISHIGNGIGVGAYNIYEKIEQKVEEERCERIQTKGELLRLLQTEKSKLELKIMEAEKKN